MMSMSWQHCFVFCMVLAWFSIHGFCMVLAWFLHCRSCVHCAAFEEFLISSQCDFLPLPGRMYTGCGSGSGDRSGSEEAEERSGSLPREMSTPLRARSRSPKFFRQTSSQRLQSQSEIAAPVARPLAQLPEGWGAWQSALIEEAQPVAVPTEGDECPVAMPTEGDECQQIPGSTEGDGESSANRRRRAQPAAPEDTEGDKPTSNNRGQGGDSSCDMNTETAATEGPESAQRSQSWQDRDAGKWGYKMMWLECSFDKGTLWTYNKERNWWQHWTPVVPEQNWHRSQASNEVAALEQGIAGIIRASNEMAPSEPEDQAMDK